MAFCVNCGNKNVEGAKFCANCGTAIAGRDSNKERKIVYEGELHKCPNCGELIESFIINCPSCGYELRNIITSKAVKDFFCKIEQAVSDEEKVTLIRNFPISNTKEDIFEFIIYASTNDRGESNKSVFNAWVAKLEQCYQKAELLFGDDIDFQKIKKIYEQNKKDVYKEKKLHGIKSIGHTIIRFYSNMKNPIFGVVFSIVIIANIAAMLNGSFESDGTSIFYSLIILVITYVITRNKR